MFSQEIYLLLSGNNIVFTQHDKNAIRVDNEILLELDRLKQKFNILHPLIPLYLQLI